LSFAGVRDYMLAHPNNLYYASSWTRVTRAALTATFSHSYVIGADKFNCFYVAEGGAIFGGGLGSFMEPAGSNYSLTTGNRFFSVGMNGDTGAPGTPSPLLFNVGTAAPYSGFSQNKCPSMIFYRGYIEDLTVSGRTYAQVHAEDKALFDEAFGVGGRFYGDTFSNPGSVIP
jgi:hypothetical protein